MKKVTWIVMKDGNEISRHNRKAIAEAVAHEVGGFVAKYTKE